jgi:hypothetical protein
MEPQRRYLFAGCCDLRQSFLDGFTMTGLLGNADRPGAWGLDLKAFTDSSVTVVLTLKAIRRRNRAYRSDALLGLIAVGSGSPMNHQSTEAAMITSRCRRDIRTDASVTARGRRSRAVQAALAARYQRALRLRAMQTGIAGRASFRRGRTAPLGQG